MEFENLIEFLEISRFHNFFAVLQQWDPMQCCYDRNYGKYELVGVLYFKITIPMCLEICYF